MGEMADTKLINELEARLQRLRTFIDAMSAYAELCGDTCNSSVIMAYASDALKGDDSDQRLTPQATTLEETE